MHKHYPLKSNVIRVINKTFISHYVEVCIKEKNNSNDPFAAKLHKKQRNYEVALAKKLRKTTFRDVYHMTYLQRTIRIFVNHYLQIEPTT